MLAVSQLSDNDCQQDRFLTAPQDRIFCTEPTGYLQEKQFSLELMQQLVELRVAKDPWYDDCLEYPLVNTQGQLCGYERIYPRGVLHKRCPDRFSPKDNKKVTRHTQTSKCFALVGMTIAELSEYFGTVRIVGGIADSVSVYLATDEPVISIVGENNAASIVSQLTEQWPHLKRQLVVALDHDLPGIFACHRAGCQWLVPEQYGDDWSDVRQREGLTALKQQLLQPARQPLIPVDLQSVTTHSLLSDTISQQNFKQAIGTLQSVCSECPAQAVSAALKIIQRFHHLVPARLSEQQMMDAINMACRFCVHPDTLKALSHKLYGYRQQQLDVVRQNDSFSPRLIQSLGTHYHQITDSISPRTIDLSPEQLIFIKAGHGTGKTKTARALIHGLSQNPEARILSISANCALTQEVAESFGLDHYQSLHPDSAATVNRLATTVHSLNKCQVSPVYKDPDGSIKKIDVLLLDEITQILSAFTSGKIDQPEWVFHTLLDLIEKTVENGGVVLCMDADLSSDCLWQFREWFPHLCDRIEVYDKPFEDSDIKVGFGTGIKARNAAIADLLDRIKLGQIITVASDSKKLVNDLREQIEQNNPDLSCLSIHADNSSHPEGKAFLQQPNAEAPKYSAVLYSPAIVGGLSVTSVKPDHCFVFSYNKLDAPAIMQQMFRYRKTEEFTVVADLMPPSKDCEDFLQRIHCLERMAGFDVSQPAYASDYVGFVEQQRASKARLLKMGANALWDYLEQRKITVTPLSESLNLGNDNSGTADELKAIRQKHRAGLPRKLVQAKQLTETEYQQLSSQPLKTENEHLSCQRYRICLELGIDPKQLSEDDCDFWLDTGARKFSRACMTPFANNLSLEAHEDDRDIPLCHRKYESLEQKYLHYLTEPLRNDSSWLKEWTETEAGQVIDRVLQIEKECPWALKRLGLIPASMIQGAGQHQKVVRPKQPNRYVTFLLNQLGLKTVSRQARVGSGQRIRYYSLESASCQRMMHYIRQKARNQGLNRVSQITGTLYKTEASGLPPETFVDWHARRWRCGVRQPSINNEAIVQGAIAEKSFFVSTQLPPD